MSNQNHHQQHQINKPTLEDFIFEMETRPPENQQQPSVFGGGGGGGGIGRNGQPIDLWSQLQKKDEDLLLAAELGKALLEKNEELKKQQDQINDEYSAKLERLEQEKHMLRRKLSEAESEGDIRIQELEADYRELKNKFKLQEDTIRANEHDKNALITELTSQNTRLTTQIQLANEKEMQLLKQLEDTKNLYSLRNSNLQDHVNGLESLKDELRMVSRNKDDLEKRLQGALIEKDTLCSTLDEASDRIRVLERHVKEQELVFQSTVNNLHRIQRENHTFSERLEENSPDHSSLHHEMECDDDLLSKSYDDTHPIIQEAITVYNQLKMLYSTLKSNNDCDSGLHSDLFLGVSDNIASTSSSTDNIASSASSSSAMTISQSTPMSNGGSATVGNGSGVNVNNSTSDSRLVKLQQGMLSSIADDLIHLIMGLDVVHFKTMLDQSRKCCIELEEQLRQRKETIMDLECKVSMADVELKNLIEERNRARDDASENNMAHDEIITKAREDRDQAMTRKTKAEVELAKTRVELMQSNSELLEAINQKVQLSETIEQWQIDMQELIDDQMRRQLNESRMKSKQLSNANNPVPKKTNRLLSYFNVKF